MGKEGMGGLYPANDIVINEMGGGGGLGGTPDSSSAPSGYDYGYPFGIGGGTQPNVTFQLAFDEASGDLIDKVSGYHVPLDSGSPTYGVNGTGDFSRFKGVRTGVNGTFLNATTTSALAPGYGDFTVEYVLEWLAANNTAISRTDTFLGEFSVGANGHTGIYMGIFFDDTSFVSMFMTTGELVDGNIHKLRIAVPRDTVGGWIGYYDGIPLGSADGPTSAKNIPDTSGIRIGYPSGDQNIVFHEFRFSKNSTNNSGGPGGG